MTDEKPKTKWEYVDHYSHHIKGNANETYRLKVPGGYLYHRIDVGRDMEGVTCAMTTSMCFVPEPHVMLGVCKE